MFFLQFSRLLKSCSASFAGSVDEQLPGKRNNGAFARPHVGLWIEQHMLPFLNKIILRLEKNHADDHEIARVDVQGQFDLLVDGLDLMRRYLPRVLRKPEQQRYLVRLSYAGERCKFLRVRQSSCHLSVTEGISGT